MIVYTGGTFDLFHSGHCNFLKKCKQIAGFDGKVIVSLNTDDFIFSYKKNFPICNYNERKEVLLSCKYVDDVIENMGGKDSKISILLVNPDIIIVGSDWAKKDYYSQMNFTQDWLNEKNISLAYIPYTEKISSTKIKNKILNYNKQSSYE